MGTLGCGGVVAEIICQTLSPKHEGSFEFNGVRRIIQIHKKWKNQAKHQSALLPYAVVQTSN